MSYQSDGVLTCEVASGKPRCAHVRDKEREVMT